MNQKDGTFAEEGVLRGAAFDDNGKAMSGMGSVAADYNHSGWLSLFRTNFSDERETLYRNRGQGEFEDATVNTGMAHNTRFVGWGSQFLDFDNDGWKDLLLVNGHVFPEVERKNIDIHFKERRICYRNSRNGKFEDISERAGQGVLDKHSSRGVAVADIDNDGAVEVLVNNQGERPSLLKMANQPAGNWLILKLEGTKSNRSAIGATVKLTAAGITQLDEVHSGGGYASQNDLRLHFGLAQAEKIDKVEIAWPSGIRQTVEGLAVNRIHAIKEPAAN
jgi:enediyne biosynthesis protein E4